MLLSLDLNSGEALKAGRSVFLSGSKEAAVLDGKVAAGSGEAGTWRGIHGAGQRWTWDSSRRTLRRRGGTDPGGGRSCKAMAGEKFKRELEREE